MRKLSSRKKTSELMALLFYGLCARGQCLPGCVQAHAQSAEFTQNKGNSNVVELEVPLGNYPGRGVSLPVSLRYSSGNLWRIGFINSIQWGRVFGAV
jgi:hypothetical protein